MEKAKLKTTVKIGKKPHPGVHGTSTDARGNRAAGRPADTGRIAAFVLSSVASYHMTYQSYIIFNFSPILNMQFRIRFSWGVECTQQHWWKRPDHGKGLHSFRVPENDRVTKA